MKKVLVLCKSNSCRSQMAEGYINFYGHNHAHVSSAGIESDKVNPYAIQVMAEDGIDVSQNTSKDYTQFEGVNFDYVLLVCDEVIAEVPKTITADKFIPFEIPDPAVFEGTEAEKLEEFRRVRELVKKFILKFIGKELIKYQTPVLSW